MGRPKFRRCSLEVGCHGNGTRRLVPTHRRPTHPSTHPQSRAVIPLKADSIGLPSFCVFTWIRHRSIVFSFFFLDLTFLRIAATIVTAGALRLVSFYFSHFFLFWGQRLCFCGLETIITGRQIVSVPCFSFRFIFVCAATNKAAFHPAPRVLLRPFIKI